MIATPRTFCALAGVTAGMLGLLAAGSAAEAITISAGSASIAEGTATATIPITVSGGGPISKLALTFAVGDGGPALGGTDVVPIINPFSISGGIFDVPAYNTSVTATPELPSASATVINIVIMQPALDAIADGLLVNLTLDTSSLPAGSSFTLYPTNDLVPTEAASSGGLVHEIDFVNGTLSVVPEPTSSVLLGLLSPLLMRRRRSGSIPTAVTMS